MAMPGKRLNTSQSESGLSVNSRLSDKRREKLMSLQQREELKDALTEKFKARFGHQAQNRGDDEVSVASGTIRREVDQFADRAAVTEANLGRLEKRLHVRATRPRGGPASEDAVSMSGVSAYTGASRMSHSRSLTGMAGARIVNRTEQPKADWSRLDEYASYLHEQDAMRQKLGVQALQRKLRADLDTQVAERCAKQEDGKEEDRRYHKNMMVELDRWKASEHSRAEEMRLKIQKEKADRDEQLDFEKKLKGEVEDRKKQEEADLVDKIVNEMEQEQKKFEKKKLDTKKAMRKVFEENMEDQHRRDLARKEQQDKEAAAMKEYNRILDEQEEQRAEELAQRMDRQKSLMEKLQANVEAQAKETGDNDALRAKMQQDEIDRHYAEAEQVKQRRLKQLKLETQAYQFKQMAEKDLRKQDERELQNIQAQILEKDTEEYNEIEKQKFLDKRLRLFQHRQEVEGQIASRAMQRVPEMSDAEAKMNSKLLGLVDRALCVRDERAAAQMEDEMCGGDC